MGPVLRTAVVTAAWIVVQGLVGFLLLGRNGRPYKALIVVIHIIVFLYIAAGWFYTVQGLSTVSGNHVGSWIAQIVMGLAVVSQVVVGAILAAGRKVPAPVGLVLVHKVGIAVALLGSLAGIVCLLSGAHRFSFNDPKGMCPECNGLGRKMGFNMDLVLDESKSLNEGAILYPGYAPGNWEWNILNESRLFDMDKKIADYTKKERDLLLYGKAQKVSLKFGGKAVNLTYEGAIEKLTNKYIKKDLKTYSARTQETVEPYLSMVSCPLCKGARLSPEALGVKVGGHNIAELQEMEVDELVEVVRGLSAPEAEPILEALESSLTHLCDIGLEYLSLNRETDSLSGGESARVKMVKHLTSCLVDVMYIFDEPSVGLHPRDVHRLNELLRKLRDKGNTVLVVEHDPEVIKIADYVVDLGPLAGRRGGEVVFQGSFDALLKAPTLTGRHMKKAMPIKAEFRKASGSIPIRKAKVNNLKNVSVDIPAGVFTVVTGVAGSGKSSLVHQSFVPQPPLYPLAN